MLRTGMSQLAVVMHFEVNNSIKSSLFHRIRISRTVNDCLRHRQLKVITKSQQNFIRLRHLRDQFTTARATTRQLHVNLRFHCSRIIPCGTVRNLFQSMRTRYETAIRNNDDQTRCQ